MRPDAAADRASYPRRPRMEVAEWQLRGVRAALALVAAVAPGLASKLVLRIFRTIRKHPRPQRETEWLGAAEHFDVAVPDGKIAAFSWGEGPPVLLAHGWEGRGSQMGALGTGLAVAGLRAITYDAPGHGDSYGRTSSLVQYADAVRQMIEAAGPFSGFVGHSFGVAGACFALRRGDVLPEQLGRLVFVAPPGDLHRFIRLFERMLGLSADVVEGFERRLEELLSVPWAEARHCTVRAACDVPLLILHDEEDGDTPLAEARGVAAAWPRARLVETSRLGHRRILRAPGIVRETVEFLSATD